MVCLAVAMMWRLDGGVDFLLPASDLALASPSALPFDKSALWSIPTGATPCTCCSISDALLLTLSLEMTLVSASPSSGGPPGQVLLEQLHAATLLHHRRPAADASPFSNFSLALPPCSDQVGPLVKSYWGNSLHLLTSITDAPLLTLPLPLNVPWRYLLASIRSAPWSSRTGATPCTC